MALALEPALGVPLLRSSSFTRSAEEVARARAAGERRRRKDVADREPSYILSVIRSQRHATPSRCALRQHEPLARQCLTESNIDLKKDLLFLIFFFNFKYCLSDGSVRWLSLSEIIKKQFLWIFLI